MDSLRRGKERKGKENGRETWYWELFLLFLFFSFCFLVG